MSEFALVSAAHMRALVNGLGCYEAAVETINANFPGSASKAAISRKMNGSLDWTLKDTSALQGARMSFPVTGLMIREQNRLEVAMVDPRRPADKAEMTARFSVDAGEMISALIRAGQSRRIGDLTDTAKEIQDVITGSTALLDEVMAEIAELSRAKP